MITKERYAAGLYGLFTNLLPDLYNDFRLIGSSPKKEADFQSGEGFEREDHKEFFA